MLGSTRSVLAFAALSLVTTSSRGQTFTKITDPANPIVTDRSVEYSGAAWVDVDGDRDLDLFVNNSFLYRNEGGGSFTRLSTAIGSGVLPATGNGTTWADYDNDGDLDVYLVSRSSYLYRNDGTGTFTRENAGVIGEGAANRGWAGAWGDFDLDGNVDLAITHAAGFVPPTTMPTTNHLLRNEGPPGYAFARITSTPITSGLSSFTVGSWSDHDGDGDPDYFIGAGPADGTLQPDFLYRNLLAETGSASFERITEPPLGTDLQDGQLWNWIDHDNDGDLDAYLTNWGGAIGGMANRLYRNDGGTFTAVTSSPLSTDVGISLSSSWQDFDNDGDLDCFVANDNNTRSAYYRNEGDGTFTRVMNALAEVGTHRGASAGDYDQDGDVDLYVDGPAGGRSLFRNDSAPGNHWLSVRLVGTVSNRSGIGAKVRARATINSRPTVQLREVSAQNTFNGHDDLNPHFGLGDAAVVDEIEVEWPSGIVQRVLGVSADRALEIVEAAPPPPPVPPIPDGAFVPGTPVRVSKGGGDLLVTWDAVTCPAVAVSAWHGLMGDYSRYTGAECDLPPTGLASLSLPSRAWLLLAATDGESRVGSHGRDSFGRERVMGGMASACPSLATQVIETCP